MNTNREHARSVDFSSLLQLVSNCLQFTLDSRHFMDRTDGLHRIGINAQILAAHSGDGGEVLGVLVREIGQVTRAISGTLVEFAQSGTQLARMAIRTADTGKQVRSYNRAALRTCEDHNRSMLLARREARWEQIAATLHDVRGRFVRHRLMLADLGRSTVFIPALVSLLKINVATYDESIAQFHQAAADLTEFREYLAQATRRMLDEIDWSISLIDTLLAQEGHANAH